MKRKVDATDGTAYKYEFADGKKVTLIAGKDGVTEDIIRCLKRMDNRQYEKNMDAAGRKPTQKEKEQWNENHPYESCPRMWNASLDFTSEDVDQDAERNLYHQMTCHHDSPDEAIDRLYELTEMMPPKRRQVLSLYLAGFKQSEIARALGLSTSTVRDHMNAAKKFIKENF